jgi:hypothetical protein
VGDPVAGEMQHDQRKKVGLSDPEIPVPFAAFPCEFASCLSLFPGTPAAAVLH